MSKNHPLTKTELTKKLAKLVQPLRRRQATSIHTNILLLYIEDIYNYIYIKRERER